MSNNGTLTNMDAASDWVDSGGYRCLDFDGSNDHVTCGSAASLDFTTDMTVAFWMRAATGIASSGYFMSKRDASTYSWGCYYKIGGITDSSVACFGGDATEVTTAVNSLVSGVWTHIAIRYRSTTVEIFINGISSATGSVTAIASNASVPVLFGARGATYPTTAANFNGHMDDWRLYRRYLVEHEIMQLARRRGIAYDRKPVMRHGAVTVSTPSATSGNLLLLGVG
jgi:hypothetical protein